MGNASTRAEKKTSVRPTTCVFKCCYASFMPEDEFEYIWAKRRIHWAVCGWWSTEHPNEYIVCVFYLTIHVRIHCTLDV